MRSDRNDPAASSDGEQHPDFLPAPGLVPGDLVGVYRLMELIGEGGMGQVWLAEQREPVRRRVALKLIKAGMDTREVVARFQSERQALAMMDHPAIAKVFDAGSTGVGRPFFVMEYVPGLSVTKYADAHRLTTQERLELVMRICDGVQHAHQKAIIHRDLKPSNILVSEVDGKPMPRIIDFGVSKAIAPRLNAQTIYTQLGTLVGSLNYMSPEQASSPGEDIDTRSDVYSLGVILYELLAGALPHDFRNITYDEVLRRLREEDVPRPSVKVRALGQIATTTARNRNTDLQVLVRQLRGDLDAITLKALEKDRQRRYGSPAELAADIGRYLRNEPVVAHAPSAAYRVGKYARRHRVGVGMAAAALLLLVAVAVAQTVALRRTTRERDRADRISDFLKDIFKVSDPSQARGNSVTARELLDKASENVQANLREDPELQASMMTTMGQVYQALGLNGEAGRLLQSSLAIRQRVLGPLNRQTLETASALVVVLTRESRFPDAEKLAKATVESSRKALGAADPLTLTVQSRLGELFEEQGRYGEAEAIQRKVLGVVQSKLPVNDPLGMLPRQDLAVVLGEEGRLGEAETMFREILEKDRREKGADDPSVLDDMNNVGACLLHEAKYNEAEALYRQTIEIQRRVLGPDHPDTLRSVGNLGMALSGQKRFPEAEELYRDLLQRKRQRLGDENRSTLMTAGDLADVLQEEKKYSEADRLMEQTVQVDRRVLGSAQPNTLAALDALGNLRKAEHRLGEAENLLAEVMESSRKNLGDDHAISAAAAYDLADVQALEGKREKAFANLQFVVNHAMGDDARTGLLSADFAALHDDPRWQPIAARANALSPSTPMP